MLVRWRPQKGCQVEFACPVVTKNHDMAAQIKGLSIEFVGFDEHDIGVYMIDNVYVGQSTQSVFGRIVSHIKNAYASKGSNKRLSEYLMGKISNNEPITVTFLSSNPCDEYECTIKYKPLFSDEKLAKKQKPEPPTILDILPKFNWFTPSCYQNFLSARINGCKIIHLTYEQAFMYYFFQYLYKRNVIRFNEHELCDYGQYTHEVLGHTENPYDLFNSLVAKKLLNFFDVGETINFQPRPVYPQYNQVVI